MNVSEVMQQTSNLYNVQAPSGTIYQGVQFEEIIKRQQIRVDIAERLKGVPMNTVVIPPEVLNKMETDPEAYSYYMSCINEYVYAYKHYNCPGVISMSFFVDEKGRCCIRGVNEILEKQIEDSKKDDHKVKSIWHSAPDVPVNSGVCGLEISNAVYSMISALNIDKTKRNLIVVSSDM